MESRAHRFKQNAAESLANPVLQASMKKAKGKFVDKRAIAIKELDAFEDTREAAKAIRNRVIENLDLWLEKFEQTATARGAKVLWAKDGAEICRLVVEIGKRHGVKKAVKSKSMLSEEAGLNQALAAAGIQPVETDLGEYILQINDNEPPSHIIAPVVHKSLDEVADLFHKTHRTPRKTDIPALTREAREVLREHFVTAEMGISGGNFLIAETGSVALVTNEGNGRMVTTLPRVHVVITGIEKVIPTLEDLATLMRLLPRSA
jgi:L-lactate dehydrogenase complex protein LldF